MQCEEERACLHFCMYVCKHKCMCPCAHVYIYKLRDKQGTKEDMQRRLKHRELRTLKSWRLNMELNKL